MEITDAFVPLDPRKTLCSASFHRLEGRSMSSDCKHEKKKNQKPRLPFSWRQTGTTIPQFQSHTVPIIVEEFEMAPKSKVRHRLLKGSILIERYTKERKTHYECKLLLAITKLLFSRKLGLLTQSA
jgi:hypothetical protein